MQNLVNVSGARTIRQWIVGQCQFDSEQLDSEGKKCLIFGELIYVSLKDV